jgi:hypothetical protein
MTVSLNARREFKADDLRRCEQATRQFAITGGVADNAAQAMRLKGIPAHSPAPV